MDTPPAEGWRPLDRLTSPAGRSGESFLWLRVRLPPAAWPNAVVHLPPVLLACEVYLDGARLAQVGTLRPDPRNRFLTTASHTVPLPGAYGGKTLAIRLFSDSPDFVGLTELPLIGPAEDVAWAVVVENLDETLLGLFLILIGLSSLLLYASRGGQARLEFLSFGAFATCVGVGPLGWSAVFRWLAGPVPSYYLVFVSFASFPVGLIAFLAQVLGEGPYRILRRIWQFHLAWAAAGLLLDVLNVVALPVLGIYLLPVLALDVAVMLVLANRGLPRGSTELKVLNFGVALLALAGMHDIASAWWFPERRGLFHWATAVFVMLLAYLLERRFTASQRQVEEQARQLAGANAELQAEIAVRKQAERALLAANADVERLKQKLEVENLYLQEEIRLEHNFENIITRNEAFVSALRAVQQVAPTESTVLILGETGTGKELVARAVHNLSARRQRPLVKVNCAALPANLIESELFGHEKGAFTGALNRQLGRFEVADGGTLFLDEVGDLPVELQAKLLRVLQEGEFERLGNPRTLRVDVRVIAATNRDLLRASAEGSFRRDLYYRLAVFPIELPPLRERREDIPLLVEHFVRRIATRTGKPLRAVSRAAMRVLQEYAWPGNVRELENVVERAVVISQGPELGTGDWLPKTESVAAASPLATLAAVEEEHIRRVLQATSWRVSGERGAASILGLKRTTLEARMRRLGISRPSTS